MEEEAGEVAEKAAEVGESSLTFGSFSFYPTRPRKAPWNGWGLPAQQNSFDLVGAFYVDWRPFAPLVSKVVSRRLIKVLPRDRAYPWNWYEYDGTPEAVAEAVNKAEEAAGVKAALKVAAALKAAAADDYEALMRAPLEALDDDELFLVATFVSPSWEVDPNLCEIVLITTT